MLQIDRLWDCRLQSEPAVGWLCPGWRAICNRGGMVTSGLKTPCTAALNQLLRGELSAVETYDQAIEKFAREPEALAFIEIRDRHCISVEQIRGKIELLAGAPSESSGPWGVVVNTAQATANMLGKDSALEMLKRGEVHGVREYEAALSNSEMEEESRELIRSVLLPRCRENIAALDQLGES